MTCPYTASGCNYPEGDCNGDCMNHSPLSKWANQKPVRWRLLGYVGIAFLLLTYGAMQAGDEMAERQSVADDKAQAQRQAQQELLKQQALQMTCGGPEATVVKLPRGGWKCLDTNGRTTKIIQRSKT